VYFNFVKISSTAKERYIKRTSVPTVQGSKGRTKGLMRWWYYGARVRSGNPGYGSPKAVNDTSEVWWLYVTPSTAGVAHV